MPTKVLITFTDKKGSSILRDVSINKPYMAEMYGPDETDKNGKGGIGFDFFLFTDDAGDEVGYHYEAGLTEAEFTYEVAIPSVTEGGYSNV